MLSMMPSSYNEEETHSAPKKATTPLFKELITKLSSKFRFKFDPLDIHYRTSTDFGVSP